MKWNLFIYVSAVAIIILLSVSWFVSTANSIKIVDSALNTPNNQLDRVRDERVVALGVSGQVADIRRLPGLILVIPALKPNESPSHVQISESIPTFRPKSDLLDTNTDPNILFQGKVTASIEFGGAYLGSASQLESNQVAEVIVKDVLFIKYADPTTIPVDKLRSLRLDPAFDYYFVEAASLTTADYRVYQETKSSGEISGTVFSANGKLYTSTDQLKSDPVVSVRVFNVRYMVDPEGSTDSQNPVPKWRNDLSSSQIESLLDNWSSRSAAELRRRTGSTIMVPKANPGAGIPDFGPILVMHKVKPRKQKTPNGCWATTLAMLRSWKTGGEIDLSDYLNELGKEFIGIYEFDRGLSNEQKKRLPYIAGLHFEYGQSYLVDAIRQKLERNGPIWFTVSRNMNSHANVVIGLSGSGDWDATFVHYIDPAMGAISIESFSDFTRRYGEAASFPNTWLYVIHWPDNASK